MNFARIIVGIIIFTGGLSLMLALAGNLGEKYNSNDAAELKELSGDYSTYSKVGLNDTTGSDASFMRDIYNFATEIPVAGSGVEFLAEAVSGTQKLKDSVNTVERVSNKVATDSGIEEAAMITTIIKSIFFTIVGLIILAMLMRARPEV